jgi:hypothetical protein
MTSHLKERVKKEKCGSRGGGGNQLGKLTINGWIKGHLEISCPRSRTLFTDLVMKT